ncbi:MAG: CHAT domain-containing protein [Pyrinomonadaceae bacterium]
MICCGFEVQRRDRGGPVVVADPRFDLDVDRNAPTSPKSSSQSEPIQGPFDFSKARFTPLPGTAGEAQALSTLLPTAKVLTSERATKEAIQKLAGPSILHIATHGFFLQDAQVQLLPNLA